MTSRTGSLGTVLQGVSQQQPRVRLHGQVKEQINMHSDVVQGLISRPPVVSVANLTGSATILKFDDLEIDGVRYIVGWRDGVLKIWDTAGTEYTVNTQDAPISIEGDGTFTESSKNLNKTGAFSAYTWVSGDTIRITGGTAVITGSYTIASKTDDDNIVLAATITSDASDPTDVSAADEARDYIGNNMQFHVYDDTIYCNNSDKVVAEDPAILSDDFLQGQGLVICLGGAFGRRYVVEIVYDSDGTSRKCDHAAVGLNSNEVEGDFIIQQIDLGLRTSGGTGNTNTGTLKGTTTVLRLYNHLLITDTAETFEVIVNDAVEGRTMRAHVDLARKVEDLVRYAPNGTLVKVAGDQFGGDEFEDDFWMRFDVPDVAIGAGFGDVGTWRESMNAFEATSLDFATMPHILFKVGNEFFFERNLWQKRRTGDSDTNEHPSIVGFPIEEIGGFQSRLMFTAGPNVVSSRTNIPSDFYKKSVVVDTDTDPLDFASTTESEVELKWFVPFDRDMLIMSEKHQFIISGENALTPKNAAMVLTTDFEMAGKARPSSTGRTILFPYLIGVHAGIKEFFSSDEIASNGADNITETLSKYIDGDIDLIATSTNFNTALIHTDHVGSEHILWVYKYLWEGIEKKQSSMSKWTFPLDITYAFWDNETIFLVMRDGNDYVLASMDMDFAVHAVGFTPTLDRQVDLTADASFQVTADFDNAVFVQHTGCANPGSQVTETGQTGSGPYVYTFDEAVVPENAIVVAGLVYDQYVEPTMPFVRDRNGQPVIDNKLVVTEFMVVFEDSGTIASLMTSKYRANETFSNLKAITVGDVEDVLQIGIRSGDFRIPWGENSEWSQLRLTSTGIRPMSILEIEWRGQAFKRGK